MIALTLVWASSCTNDTEISAIKKTPKLIHDGILRNREESVEIITGNQKDENAGHLIAKP